MLTAIIFVLLLGILIFVHELGHFVTARRNGIKVDEFGFGFPPRIFGVVKDAETGKHKIVRGNKETNSAHTVYSINWIPLGGFVKIKGESGENKDADSFASKGAWTRVKVLAAGVIMNFVLAWVLLSIALIAGVPEAIDEKDTASRMNSKIQIAEVSPRSPAQEMGLMVGDEIIKDQIPEQKGNELESIEKVQQYVASRKGEEIVLRIKRGNEFLDLKGIPREETTDGQGPLGVSLAQTAIVQYPWFRAIIKGAEALFLLMAAMLGGLWFIIKSLIFGQGVPVEVAGPIGIAVITKQVTALGIAYLLQFAAFLSINLGIINAFPFPALDGGRILFIIIERIKGSPVKQRTEQMAHTIGFMLLILLMVFVTFKDVMRFLK